MYAEGMKPGIKPGVNSRRRKIVKMKKSAEKADFGLDN
jgi:hypothetical protein